MCIFEILVLDPTPSAETAAAFAGYRKDIYVRTKEGYFRLVFYTVDALTEEYEFYHESQGFYPIDNNLCVVHDLSPETIVFTIKLMLYHDYFGEAKPIDVAGLSLFPFHPEIRDPLNVKYYIASRHGAYKSGSLLKLSPYFQCSELVTMDQGLVPIRRFDPQTGQYIGVVETFEEIKRHSFSDREQLMKCVAVRSEVDPKDEFGFEFCGYDIMGCFDYGSWLNCFKIPYDDSPRYTQYGILKSYAETMKWLEQHKENYEELQSGEYTIYAVWRLLN